MYIKKTLSALVAAVKQAWVPSYFPIVTIPGVVLWFKLNEKTGFTDKFILFTIKELYKNIVDKKFFYKQWVFVIKLNAMETTTNAFIFKLLIFWGGCKR